MWKIIRHLFFWLVIMVWTSTIYVSNKTTSWQFIQFNLVRLPLLMLATYAVIYYLLPKFIFHQKAYFKFALIFTTLFILTTLLDRWVIGSKIIDEILKDSGLTYTFFNEIPLFRNAFLLLSIIGLATTIRLFNYYRKTALIVPSNESSITNKQNVIINPKEQKIETTKEEEIESTFLVKSGAITHMLKWEEILFLEKDENYVIYHTKEKRILQRTTLSKLLPNLPNYFCRIHRSFVIPLPQIEQIERDFLVIKGKKIPIGRTYKMQFLKRLS